MIDSRDFLDIIAGYSNSNTNGPQSSASRPVKLATIDQYYTSGPARVLFDGETVMSERAYSWASPYAPKAGERVYLIPVGQSYLIGGSITSKVSYPEYHEIPLSSNFSTYSSSSFHAPSFTKTETGIVKLTGLVQHNSITTSIAANTQIGTLPPGFRPQTNMWFPVMTGASNLVAAVYIVAQTGGVYTGNGVQGVWASLANVVFPTQDLTWVNPAMINGWENGNRYGADKPVQYARDSLGRVWLRGSFGETGTSKTADSTVFSTPGGFRPDPQAVYTIATSTASSNSLTNVYWDTAGNFNWRLGSSVDDDVTVDGIVAPPDSANWVTPTLAGTWVSYGAANTPGYFKDSEGVVHLRGLVKTGTINTTLFTLPAGYRPSRTIVRATVSNGSTLGRLDIRADGVVLPVTGSNVWYSLDNVTFTAEA